MGESDEDEVDGPGGPCGPDGDGEDWQVADMSGMKYSEFETEVVKAARYGAALEGDNTGIDNDEGWQEAEVEKEEGVEEGPIVLPNGGHSSTWTAPMPDDKIDAVKNAMSGFALPPEATPAWAQDIPEEVWMKALTGGVAGLDLNALGLGDLVAKKPK